MQSSDSTEGPLWDQPPTPPNLPAGLKATSSSLVEAEFFSCLQNGKKWQVAKRITRTKIDGCCHGDDSGQ